MSTELPTISQRRSLEEAFKLLQEKVGVKAQA